MRILEGRLDEYYYGLRNQVIRDMCTGTFSESPRFRRIFPEDEYYIAPVSYTHLAFRLGNQIPESIDRSNAERHGEKEDF